MKVLVVGGGGREHALVWKIAQSPRVDKIYCAPGNAGIATIAECVSIAADNVNGLKKFVNDNDIDLTVIGPEASLAAGLADALTADGRAVFGPTKAAAAIESSKSFAKELMRKYHISTADAEVFTEVEPAVAYIKQKGTPIVVKADGLAAGKGVIIAKNEAEAIAAVASMLEGNAFGDAGSQVLIEEYLEGEEVSILAFCDGKTIVPMVSAQDHKRAFDGDKGPNTGGMGAYSPAPAYTPQVAAFVEQHILHPTINAMAAEGRPYQGVLYAGLMLTEKGPKVLEYNARFGDPETQPVLMRLKTDIIDIIEVILAGKLDQIKIEWYDQAAVCVVIAAGGYPGSYRKGDLISGIDDAEAAGATVFHAGTKFKEGAFVSAGGRVLGVTAMAESIADAITKAYAAVDKISFADCFNRSDIGAKAINR